MYLVLWSVAGLVPQEDNVRVFVLHPGQMLESCVVDACESLVKHVPGKPY